MLERNIYEGFKLYTIESDSDGMNWDIKDGYIPILGFQRLLFEEGDDDGGMGVVTEGSRGNYFIILFLINTIV